MTLVAGATRPPGDLTRRSASLAEGFEPFPVGLNHPEGRDEHFRALYLPVRETLKLLTAWRAARTNPLSALRYQ